MLKNMLGLLPHPFPSAAPVSLIKVAWLSHSCRITMKRLDLFTALLCSLSWIFISGSGPETVEVRQGEDVTLACSNTSTEQSQSIWFRLVNRTKPNAIASMFIPTQKALICPGFDKTKFEMTSNISTLFVHIMRADGAKPGYCEGYKSGKFVMGVTNSSVFLNITQVDVSDSGSCFCGFYTEGLLYFTGVQLNIKGDNESYEKDNHTHGEKLDSLPMICMGCLSTFLLMIIIGLIVKLRKLQRAHKPQKTPTTLERNDFEEIEELKYATVAFQPKQGRQRRDAEPNVIYSATRLNRN
eukprot:XP_011618774.1 PREDICTED: uncharacterized protein LOC101067077 [Takifugu rubripes]